MKLDTLESLKDDELLAVIDRSNELLKERDTARKEKALNEARATLAAVGLTLKDLLRKTPKSKAPVLYHTGRMYQNPADKTQVWPGKGKKPGWLVALEAEGGKAVEIVPANDNTPVSLKKTG